MVLAMLSVTEMLVPLRMCWLLSLNSAWALTGLLPVKAVLSVTALRAVPGDEGVATNRRRFRKTPASPKQSI